MKKQFHYLRQEVYHQPRRDVKINRKRIVEPVDIDRSCFKKTTREKILLKIAKASQKKSS